MIERILNLFVVELIKAVRLRLTYLGPVLVLLTVVVAPLAYPIQRDQAGDYGFIAYAVQLLLNNLGFFVVLVYCSSLVSGEIGTGTIRSILVRPVRRREVLIAKFLIGMSYATTLTVIAAALAWGLAFTLGDLSGVYYGGEVVYTNREMQSAFISALLLGLLPQYAAVAYAMLISTCVRNATSAVGFSVGIWLFVDTVKYPLNIPQLFFSSYTESSWRGFIDRANGLAARDIGYSMGNGTSWLWTLLDLGVITSVVSIAAFSSIALYVFTRRNMT